MIFVAQAVMYMASTTVFMGIASIFLAQVINIRQNQCPSLAFAAPWERFHPFCEARETREISLSQSMTDESINPEDSTHLPMKVYKPAEQSTGFLPHVALEPRDWNRVKRRRKVKTTEQKPSRRKSHFLPRLPLDTSTFEISQERKSVKNNGPSEQDLLEQRRSDQALMSASLAMAKSTIVDIEEDIESVTLEMGKLTAVDIEQEIKSVTLAMAKSTIVDIQQEVDSVTLAMANLTVVDIEQEVQSATLTMAELTTTDFHWEMDCSA